MKSYINREYISLIKLYKVKINLIPYISLYNTYYLVWNHAKFLKNIT